MSDIVGTITISRTEQVTKEFIDDLMTTAFDAAYGGSWFWIQDYIATLNGKSGSTGSEIGLDYFHDCISLGGTLELATIEEEEERVFLTLQNLIGAVQEFCARFNTTLDQLAEEIDANLADSLIQFAVFGEERYG